MGSMFYHKDHDDKEIKLSYGAKASDAEYSVYFDYIDDIIAENDIDADVVCIYCHGSRIYGNPKENSDLDFVVFYIGDEREDNFFNCLTDSKFYWNGIKCDFNPIRIGEWKDKENIDIEKKISKYIEEHDQINENMFTPVAMGNSGGLLQGYSGFSYDIKPLSFNLCQAGNDPGMENRNKAFKHFVGDIVKGYCPFDKKEHKGMIKYLYFTPEGKAGIPTYVYIQDFETEDTIAIEPKTIRTCGGIDKKFVDSREVMYRSQNTGEFSSIVESFDFNK